MKLLLTGATSPLGRRVLLGLRARHQVTVLVRPGVLDALQKAELGVPVIEVDPLCPQRYLPQLQDIEALVHLSQRAQGSDGEVLEYNLKATQSLLHAFSAGAQARFLLHLSTALLDHRYPDEPDVAPARYGSAWLASRCAAEARVNLWARRTGVETVIVRAGHHYGAVGVDGPLTGWMEAAAASAEGSGRLSLRGADTPLPFVHIDELARAIVARVDGQPLPGETHLVGRLSRVDAVGMLLSLGQLHQQLCARTERRARLIEPRSSLGRRLLARLGAGESPKVPRFLRRQPVKQHNAAWRAEYGARDPREIAEALVGGAC